MQKHLNEKESRFKGKKISVNFLREFEIFFTIVVATEPKFLFSIRKKWEHERRLECY